MTQSKIESLKDSSDLSRKFGTFKGVFTPSILTILGVIMFLRMGWVLGHAGLIGTLVIVTIGSGITFLTALSISATATNPFPGTETTRGDQIAIFVFVQIHFLWGGSAVPKYASP